MAITIPTAHFAARSTSARLAFAIAHAHTDTRRLLPGRVYRRVLANLTGDDAKDHARALPPRQPLPTVPTQPRLPPVRWWSPKGAAGPGGLSCAARRRAREGEVPAAAAADSDDDAPRAGAADTAGRTLRVARAPCSVSSAPPQKARCVRRIPAARVAPAPRSLPKRDASRARGRDAPLPGSRRLYGRV